MSLAADAPSMKRRPLLATIAASGALLSGCLAQRSAPADPAGSSNGTTNAGTATDGGSALAVDDVATFSHALRLNDLGRSPAGEVPGNEALSGRERDVVDAAVDGGYETRDLPEWLVRFVARTRYVRRDGTYYRLRAEIPRTEVTAEAANESEVEGEIASPEEYRSAVTHDGVRMTGLARIARREGLTLAYVWPSLRAFLETYEAVRYRGELLEIEATERDPGPPYTVTAERASLSDLARGPVWDATDAPAEVRSIVREAGETSGLYPLDDPPEALLVNLDDHEYVFLDGRFFTTYVEKRGPLPVSLSASFTDPAPDGDARIRMELHNDADSRVEVLSGAPAPFGVVHYHPAGDPGDRRLLWTDAYEESDHVMTDGHEVTGWNSIGLTTAIGPGGSVAREFVVEETAFPAGEYAIPGDVGVSTDGEEGGTFPYRVRFGIE